MRVGLVVALVVALGGNAMAADCGVDKTLYNQPGNAWVLKFVPVPRDGAANQVAEFQILSPGDPATVFEGAVYVPNGFGQPTAIVDLNCPAEGPCEPFWEGPIFALGENGIEDFPYDTGEADDLWVPKQVLLPKFASNVWYSMLRETAFAEAGLTDAFTFVRCVED